MRLSILITHYNETKEVYGDLFTSLSIQRGIVFEDIEIVIANDGNWQNIPKAHYEFLPFAVKQVSHSHSGISATRNLALDNASGDYVMFCDCDDMFSSAYGLHQIFGAMNENPDLIYSSFIEEVWKDDGTFRIYRHDKDVTFIHGKVFKREYLLRENIRFDDSLTIHEDGYFNVIANICAETKREITAPFYTWKWNDNSTVRKDREAYVLKTYDHLMRSRAAICRELGRRGEIDKYFDAVCKTVIDAYYDFNKPEYLDPKNAELVKAAEKAFCRFYNEFGADYLESNITRIAEMMLVCRQQAYKNGLRVEQVTIRDWLTKISRMEV